MKLDACKEAKGEIYPFVTMFSKVVCYRCGKTRLQEGNGHTLLGYCLTLLLADLLFPYSTNLQQTTENAKKDNTNGKSQ